MWDTSSRRYGTVMLLSSLLLASYSLDTLDQTQKLANGQTRVSLNGTFELGFFNRTTSTTKWYIGIWYTVSPEIIVWVANHDNPLNDSSSTLSISKGTLVLIDSLQNIIWSTSVNPSMPKMSDPILKMLDSGNLVLKDQNRDNILWQSFDYPSNTFLPGMKIGKDLTTGFEWNITSWKSRNDPSKGNYCYKMDTLGQPELVLWDGERIKFKTGAWVGPRFSGLPEMATYENMLNFKLFSTSKEVIYSIEADKSMRLSRIVLNETGVLQRIMWDHDQKNWYVYWFWPNDMCDSYAKCGPFGTCNSNEAPICKCLPGFSPKSPKEWTMRNNLGGCERETPLNCQGNSYGFKSVKSVKLPDTENATVDASISIMECKRRCSINCSCLAYSLLDISGGGSGCIMWGYEYDLIDIKYIEGGQDLYLKLDKSYLDATGKRKIQVLIGIMVPTAVMLLVLLTVHCIRLRRRKIKTGYADLGKEKSNYKESGSLHDTELPMFDLETVKAATANFSDANKLGQGGFGIVYKGVLSGGEEIAVKRLSKGSSQGLNEFKNEVMLIAKLQHRNLVRLLGCCIHDSERILIYEFMPNKSLDFFIFDKVRREVLSWTMRLEIVAGISRGILYLHQDSRFNIIHRDLKAANILLDKEMTPKVSDFGIARLFKREQNEMDTGRVVGTRGYMSPEYAMEGKISVKSDVYSFGVLLLEIISGKRNQGNHNLIAYAWQLWQAGRIIQLADEAIDNAGSVASDIVRFIHVGLLCVQECADDRPTMSTVLSMLSNEGMSLPEPKKPVLSTKITPESSSSPIELTLTCIEGR
ncbi:G-type lectin S-receptor-like Serine/Threonine-kinase [Rhynchospora pubera]|uniref:Receptor-like serine/threonine-protein kinase n=1 Tax=Rhynchospora pubera TaxID=906938 RepID=A0AAV8H469_9POAL|nr:G-type lectin S-receptor-like Serine/Threonine-kinase [Rhynchospora pubera]